MLTTNDIKEIFINKYNNGDFRILYNGEVKTIEIQNAHFIADKDYIIREPNYDYASREIEWYKSQSLFVEDIPGKTPVIWEQCADEEGKINSNYGWCIYNPANAMQYKHCLEQLLEDNSTRRACMIYSRPTMQYEWNSDGKNDFMCTFATQQFIRNNKLVYIVLMRSNDAVYGFKNDLYWAKYVAKQLITDLHKNGVNVDDVPEIYWHADSLHIYERHFKYLDEN